MKFVIMYKPFKEHGFPFRYAVYEYVESVQTSIDDYLVTVGERKFGMVDKGLDVLAKGRHTNHEHERFIVDTLEEAYREIIRDCFTRKHKN